ncbi:hypothetical protein ACFV7R_40315 [Streptomyces sp. NPDC059866]|uniref:hypothetical protein n=1 Tax=Streptomyces sp. NPDC059866 TaxID=3346978 RepID=UPI003655C3E9
MANFRFGSSDYTVNRPFTASPPPWRRCWTGSSGTTPGSLTELPVLAGAAPYATLLLADGIEMHHQPASTGEDNPIAATLAAHYGYERLELRGSVYITGDSAESDTAIGMELDPFDDLYRALHEAADTAGTRLYRKIRPDETVTVAYDDYVPGDVFWFLSSSRGQLRPLAPVHRPWAEEPQSAGRRCR